MAKILLSVKLYAHMFTLGRYYRKVGKNEWPLQVPNALKVKLLK